MAIRKVRRRDTEFSKSHNVCAFLEKSPDLDQTFHDAIDMLTRSHVYFAITEKIDVYQDVIRKFWSAARFDYPVIKSSVDGKDVIITQEDVRRVLRFEDTDEDPMEFEKDLIKEEFSKMGYQEAFVTGKPLRKTMLPLEWRYPAHILIQCIQARATGFSEINDKVASALVALRMRRPFNFSGLIFKGLTANITGDKNKKKSLIYPRFVQMILNDKLQSLNQTGLKVYLKHMDRTVFQQTCVVSARSKFDPTVIPAPSLDPPSSSSTETQQTLQQTLKQPTSQQALSSDQKHGEWLKEWVNPLVPQQTLQRTSQQALSSDQEHGEWLKEWVNPLVPQQMLQQTSQQSFIFRTRTRKRGYIRF